MVPDANSTRDGRCCSTGIPENVNFAASTINSPSMAASSSVGSSARAVAEKLPTTPPVATFPAMRDTVSDSPLSDASTFKSWTAFTDSPR